MTSGIQSSNPNFLMTWNLEKLRRITAIVDKTRQIASDQASIFRTWGGLIRLGTTPGGGNPAGVVYMLTGVPGDILAEIQISDPVRVGLYLR